MKKILVIAVLFLSILGFSQNNELGKVTVDELKEKVSPIDTSAAASIIFKTSKIAYDNFLGRVVIETNVKLKIYKVEGYKYANIEETYYNKANSGDIVFSDAITYNLVNEKIIQSKLKKESVFNEEKTKKFFIKKMVMPDVKVGSIIEYKIKRFTNSLYRLVDFYFQRDIPIKNIELTVEYPEAFLYAKNLTGYLNPEVKYEIFNSINSKIAQQRIIYKLKNVPALKDEAFVNNIDNYRSRIRYELSSVKNNFGIAEGISSDWAKVSRLIYSRDDFGDELNKTGYFEEDIDALLLGLSAQNERMNAIFNYVKSRMTWNDYKGYVCDDSVKKAYRDKKGNVAEINLMLTAMLRYAGIEANPVLISTRSNGISYLPSIASYNYVISSVELQDHVITLDATDKNSLPNILPIRDLNWFGRIIRVDGSSSDISLMPKSNSLDAISILASINPQGEISGKIREQYFDYNAYLFRDVNNGLSKEGYAEKLEKKHQGLEIGEYDIQNSTDLSKPVIENYSFTSNNSVEIIGDKMYFSPFLHLAITKNPFRQETREFPIDFIYPHQDKFTITINIPEGYIVETIPEPKAIGMSDEIGNFKYNISDNGNQIQVLYSLDVNRSIIGSEYYEELKNLYKEIVNKQTEKIVLKKV